MSNVAHVDSEFNDGALKRVAAGVAAKPQALVAAGAISVATRDTRIDLTQAGDQAFTLADGVEGQEKFIIFVTKGSTGNAVITPANLNAGTTITLNLAADSVLLKFMGTEWYVVVNVSAVVA